MALSANGFPLVIQDGCYKTGKSQGGGGGGGVSKMSVRNLFNLLRRTRNILYCKPQWNYHEPNRVSHSIIVEIVWLEFLPHESANLTVEKS